MRVLVGCEFSQIVTNAFRNAGHEAYSCDLLPTEGNPKWHIQENVLDVIEDDWDLAIFHPPCTFLAVSGNKWMKPEFKHLYPTRAQDRKDAIEFFMKLVDAQIGKIATENPIGIMSTVYRKPDQYIQPHEHGHPQSKRTCLWLKNLEQLTPSKVVTPEWIYYKNGGRSSPDHYKNAFSKNRRHLRSVTYQGIADAMAEQWG